VTASTPTRRSPGEALIVACVQPATTIAPSPALVDLAADPRMEWARTIGLAHWHGVSPRLARALVVNHLDAELPHDLDDQLQSGYFTTMARNLALRRELGRVVDELRRHQVDVMVLKGAALVPIVHRDPGVRPMDDLDLLVHREDLALAEKVVTAAGYQSSGKAPATADDDDESYHHLPSLVRADGTVTIELHHKLGSSGSPPDFDVTGVWARAVRFDAGDATCLRPSDEDLLAHVCLHFLVDRVRLFSRRALRQICDIGAAVDAFSATLDWDRLTADASERRYGAALALALGTAAMVVDMRLPDDVLTNLAPRDVVPSAAEVGRRRVLRDRAWTTLEQLTSRQPSVLHLLPPNPARWSLDDEAQRPAAGLAEGYADWLVAASRILRRPGEVGAERRFAAQLQALVFPRGLPDGSRARRPLRRELQARLSAA
jgi:hypothetical protein